MQLLRLRLFSAFSGSFFALVFVTGVAPASADSAPRGNLYHATVTHGGATPACSGPGKLPLRAKVNAENVEVTLSPARHEGEQRKMFNDSVVSLSDGGVYPPKYGCFVNVRRGTEVVTRETLCPNSSGLQSFGRWAAAAGISTDLKVQAEICMSPTSVSLISGHWELDMTSTLGPKRISGDLLEENSAMEFQLSSVPTSFRNLQNPNSGLMVGLSLDCIDTGFEFESGRSAFVSTYAEFIMSGKGDDECKNAASSCYSVASKDDRRLFARFVLRRMVEGTWCKAGGLASGPQK